MLTLAVIQYTAVVVALLQTPTKQWLVELLHLQVLAVLLTLRAHTLELSQEAVVEHLIMQQTQAREVKFACG
jgi:hypothetical protein